LSYLTTTLVILISVFAALHALLNKQDPRAALGWITLCVFVPIFGPILYLFLGINRSSAAGLIPASKPNSCVRNADHDTPDHPLDRVASKLSRFPCSRDNRVRLLRNGEQAYPVMLNAIENARSSVLLCTYIFDSDDIGQKFVAALTACVKRGVEVRVLVDSIGSLYSLPSAIRLLRKAHVPTSRFLPLLHRHSWQFNMRNHRKMLVIDGDQAFTGGMNIGSRHMVGRHRARSSEDVQFQIDGDAAKSLAKLFCEDWEFATRTPLDLGVSERHGFGETICRPISDGPGADFGTLPKLLLGLIGTAARSITIVTPYFLPPPVITGALVGASLRGVKVQLLIPERTNLPYVTWATEHALAPIVDSSISVYMQPKPFSHTKMLLIDDDFLQIGSYNMDVRSLRLNFELAVNILDRSLRSDIDSDIEIRMARSKQVDSSYLRARSLPIRIRNAIFWLFTPYL